MGRGHGALPHEQPSRKNLPAGEAGIGGPGVALHGRQAIRGCASARPRQRHRRRHALRRRYLHGARAQPGRQPRTLRPSRRRRHRPGMGPAARVSNPPHPGPRLEALLPQTVPGLVSRTSASIEISGIVRMIQNAASMVMAPIKKTVFNPDRKELRMARTV